MRARALQELCRLPDTESEIGAQLVKLATDDPAITFQIVTYDPALMVGYGRKLEGDDFSEDWWILFADRAGNLVVLDGEHVHTITATTLEDLDQTEWVFPE